MSSEESVTAWLEGLRAGRETAATELWNHFYGRLIVLARQWTGRGPHRVEDEEDVAAMALESFFLRIREGRFPQLDDRDDLWHLLVKFTEYKVLSHLRGQRRAKRGGGKVRGDSAFALADGSASGAGLDSVPGREPTPAFAAEVRDEFRRLLGLLNEDLRRIAVLKMGGHKNQKIAKILGCSTPTIERRLRLIRQKWRAAVSETA
jgi:RNA polymerase sigma factor (sigma-70 family)